MRRPLQPVLFVLCFLALDGYAGKVAAERTLIPLPEIIVDPNEGTTVGVLPEVSLDWAG